MIGQGRPPRARDQTVSSRKARVGHPQTARLAKVVGLFQAPEDGLSAGSERLSLGNAKSAQGNT